MFAKRSSSEPMPSEPTPVVPSPERFTCVSAVQPSSIDVTSIRELAFQAERSSEPTDEQPAKARGAWARDDRLTPVIPMPDTGSDEQPSKMPATLSTVPNPRAAGLARPESTRFAQAPKADEASTRLVRSQPSSWARVSDEP